MFSGVWPNVISCFGSPDGQQRVIFLYIEVALGQFVQMDFSVQVTSTNVDIATVAPHYHLYSQTEVEEVISRL